MQHIRKTTLMLVTLLVGFISFMQAQDQKTWQWVGQLGGKSWDIASGIVCDSKNNLYVAGSFFDTLCCSNKKIRSAGDQDIFIVRYDEKGNIKNLWKAGGKGRDQATCIAVGKYNDIVVGGIINNEVTFGDLTDKAAGKRLFVTKLTEKGKFTWLSTFTPTGDASLSCIGTDGKGKIYAAGVFSGNLSTGNSSVTSNGKKDIFMARLDAGGTIEELIALGGEEDDLPTSLSVSDSGSIILAVTTGRAFRADNIELETFENKTGSHAFIFRFDDNFRALWKAQITGEEYGHVASVRQDPQGSIYAAGSFNLRLLAEDTVLLSKGYSDGFLIKYGPEGKVTWARDFGTWYFDYASQLIIDNLGGTMITGSVGDTLLIDDLNVNPLSGNNSALVIQFSSDGRATWADCISGNGRNFSDGAVIDRKGNLYLTGAFRGVFEKESDALTSHGDQDIFVAKYFNCPESESEIKGDRVICPGLPAHLSVDDEYSHVVWNDTLSGEHYIVAEKPGIYRVTMMDKQGCVQSDSVELILAAEPDFTLGNDVSLPVESLFELKAPDGFRNYRWQDNSENQTFMAQAVDGEPGTVICWLTAVDSLGCPVSDTIAVEFYLEPQWLDPNTVVLITYPNPVAGWLNWSINVDQPCRLFLELTDNNGKPVVNHYIGQYQPGSTMKTDLSNIPSGVYFLRLRNSTGQASESVCIIRQ